MACLHGDRSDTESRSNSLSEALLFATMCIIGLPVEVLVKDGSVYSGIFHTASVEGDYGVVLKKARMIKNGKMKANTEKGCVIDTLVILSGDLVQLVAQGVSLPSGGISGNLDGYIAECAETIPTFGPEAVLTKKCGKFTTNISDINQTRGSQSSQREDDGHGLKFEFRGEASSDEVCESNPSSISKQTPVNPSEERRTIMESKELSIGLSKVPISALTRQDSQACESVDPVNIPLVPVSLAVSTSVNAAVNNAATVHDAVSLSTALASPHSSESNKTTKEFKLNPDAKIFSPSFTNPTTPPPVPTVSRITCIPNNSNVVPVAGSHAEVGSNSFPSRASVPSKVVPYGNLLAGNGVSGSQLSQPIVGHMGTRMQPLRYAGQYPVRSAPAYGSQNSQAAMAGRLGQLIYMHPVSHDLVQAPTTLSQICVRPLLTSPNAHFPKHQGSGGSQAACIAPPFVGNGHPPVAVPNHIPHWQPSFPVNRPIQISSSNAFFPAKFS